MDKKLPRRCIVEESGIEMVGIHIGELNVCLIFPPFSGVDVGLMTKREKEIVVKYAPDCIGHNYWCFPTKILRYVEFKIELKNS